jgi:hypothetical protein
MSRGRVPVCFVLICGAWFVAALSSVPTASSEQPSSVSVTRTALSRQAFLERYCLTCHNERLRTGGLALDSLDSAKPHANAEVWERVVAKLRARTMPPPTAPRPDAATYQAVVAQLEADIDRAWERNPNPGRINAVHRLNRSEYNNAVRDLFALDVDVRSLLPGDETADASFDNVADVLSISTAHLERYLSVARYVTRLAVGLPPPAPAVQSFDVPLHVVQDERQSEDLPFGSRGGIAVRYTFPVDGDYRIRVRLRRQYQDYVMGMGWPQQLDLRLDGTLVKRFTVGGAAPGRPAAASYAGDGEPGFAGAPEWERYMQLEADAGLEIAVPVQAGPHTIGVSFVRELWEPEGLPQPVQRGRVLTNDQIYMGLASVGSVQIIGPSDASTGSGSSRAESRDNVSEGKARNVSRRTSDTPSRRAIFICQPRHDGNELRCATEILSRLARLAYRRPVSQADLQPLLEFFATGRRDGGRLRQGDGEPRRSEGESGSFDAGIQFALERMLVDPDFLLRVYRAPAASAIARDAASYPLSNLEVASRLSFFLWGSLPDDQLLDTAVRGELTKPAVLDTHVRRMLADARATQSLVADFAAQWLNLRRLGEVVVHPDFYPNFDESLVQAFEQETRLFVASTLADDRSVLDLLRADYTFVNERLARHYGIPAVYGSRFRKVTLANREQRGGLLAHGSILATTSYPDRTSPVLRGKWLLDNMFGIVVPPPPPGVDTSFPEVKPGSVPPAIRDRLAQHRRNPVCSNCHSAIDPPGFALEHFDAIGGWRAVDEAGRPVDAIGTSASGETIHGLSGLRAALLDPPDQFPRTVTEKLLAYAIGRRLDYYDRPAVRKIVREAAASDYRWSSIIAGIVKSPTFLRRRSS